MEIFAAAVSGELLLKLTQGKRYRIHSRFPHGVNVEVDGVLSFTGNKEEERLPWGILTAPEDLQKLMSFAKKDELLWKDGSFLTEKGKLILTQAEIFFSTLGREEDMEREKKFLCRDFPALHTDRLETGLGETIKEAGDLSREADRELAEALLTGKDLKGTLARWVGRGPGLTPSGDDYLTGLMAADRLYGFLSPGFEESLKELLAQGYTTDVGKNQLLCALEGMFSGSWLNFLKAYLAEDEKGMTEQFHRILKYGHTSGRDMSAGFCMGLHMAELSFKSQQDQEKTDGGSLKWSRRQW